MDSGSIVHAEKMQCSQCGKEYPLDKIAFRCRCEGSLDIIYDYKNVRKFILMADFIREPPWHWKYWMFYPVDDLTKSISFQEGGTPLLFSKSIGTEIGCELYFKYEGINPTGSFKDRGSSIEITKAFEMGKSSVCCASTGNMGASVSSYAAKAGIDCKVFVPENTPRLKIAQILGYGADVIKVKGTYADCLRLTEEVNRRYDVYLLGDYPYRCEGQKSVGFEIVDQFYWNVPDYIICPMGNGTLTRAIWKSLLELREVRLIDELPKIVGVQSEGCSPIVDALKNDIKKPIAIRKAKTIADAIACEDPIDGTEALDAIRESEGFAEVVSDEEILNSQKLLGRSEGLFAEPSGAVSTAGLIKYRERFKGKKVVCIITGHGLKRAPIGETPEIKTIKNNSNELDKIYP
ncbi:MAG: threonine synthase [Euryarchaeota archaeon]|nr:threonine synthase [Euryarchaeota archaeon]